MGPTVCELEGPTPTENKSDRVLLINGRQSEVLLCLTEDAKNCMVLIVQTLLRVDQSSEIASRRRYGAG